MPDSAASWKQGEPREERAQRWRDFSVPKSNGRQLVPTEYQVSSTAASLHDQNSHYCTASNSSHVANLDQIALFWQPINDGCIFCFEFKKQQSCRVLAVFARFELHMCLWWRRVFNSSPTHSQVLCDHSLLCCMVWDARKSPRTYSWVLLEPESCCFPCARIRDCPHKPLLFFLCLEILSLTTEILYRTSSKLQRPRIVRSIAYQTDRTNNGSAQRRSLCDIMNSTSVSTTTTSHDAIWSIESVSEHTAFVAV